MLGIYMRARIALINVDEMSLNIMQHAICNPIANQRKLVVIIDDHPLILASLRDLVTLHSYAAEVRTFATFSTSLAVLKNSQPSLIFLDLGLPDIQGPEAVAIVRAVAPHSLLVVLTGNDEIVCEIPDIQNKVIPLLRKAMPYHLMNRAVGDLLAQIGVADVPNRLGPHLLQVPGRMECLSPKQREILRLLATGRSNHGIAVTQNVSIETIKTHLHDIYVKLQVKSRMQAVLIYQSAGAIHADV
jgi:DNA-binding NarL/FixJ family response regulator